MCVVGELDKVVEDFWDQVGVLFEELVVANTNLHVLQLDGGMWVACQVWTLLGLLGAAGSLNLPDSAMLDIIATKRSAATDDGSRLA